MKESFPLVSVVMPTFNRSALLPRAIQSVLDQTFSNWELVIIDDASTDATPAVLAEWQKRDGRIRTLRNEKNLYPDISQILNRALGAARGKYIARLDDDDWWIEPRKLQLQVDFLEENPSYVVVGSGVVVVDAAGKELFRYLKTEQDAAIRKHALFSNPFSHTTVMFRREEALRVGGYGNWKYAEDWDLWLKLGTRGKLYNFPLYFTNYLLAGQNKSFVHQRAQTRMLLELLATHRQEYPNYYPALGIALCQLLYSYLPLFLRRGIHPVMSYVKRSFF